ncbi:MAG TPA: TPM domain-containing protein [Myxococcales bacterium]|nr:TPM domain-containing protein [Myxococcales bacterium]
MLLALLMLVGIPADRLPDFTDYVVDRAKVVDPGVRQQLLDLASRLDHAGIAQLAVLTVTPEIVGDDSIEDFAAETFRKWGLGHGKKKADGVLIVIEPGPPGQRHTKVEVGYGLEGVLPDGKVGALYDRYARPHILRNEYGNAALKLSQAIAGVLDADAAAGGDAAAKKDTLRGGTGLGQPSYRGPENVGGVVVTALCMIAIATILGSSGARRRFPGGRSQLAAAGLTGASVASLFVAGSGVGWLVLAGGLILNAVIWASIRSHKCPKDGSWLLIDEELIARPTYWSQGLARVTQACTNPRCGYRRSYDKVLPRKQVTVVTGGGGWGRGGGGWGSGGGGGFSGGGGGDSGGGGISRSD